MIPASRVDLTNVDWTNGSPNGYGYVGQLKLASDQRIYISRWNQNNPLIVNPNTYYSLDSLDAILSPNLAGISCNFQKNYIYLDHKPTEIGLPNFIGNFTLKDPLPPNCLMSVDEQTLQGIHLSPNPFSDEITVHSDEELKNVTLLIKNTLGQIVSEPIYLNGKTASIPRGNLKSGTYFFEFSQNTVPIRTEKIMITQ